jgi:hypothetical protein
MWVFSTLLTINASTQVERSFVCKKQNVRLTNLFVLQVRELPHNWQSMKLTQGSELELKDSANVGSVIAGEGQLLMPFFRYLWTSDLLLASYIVHPI